MEIIVDTREQAPWTFEDVPGIVTVREKLETGDYSVRGIEHRVTIERKSLNDWTGTVMKGRARFYCELERMRALDFRCVIIETSVREIMAERYTSQLPPAAILGFIAEIAVAQCVPVYLGGSRAESQILAGALLRMAGKKLASSTAISPEG